MWIKEAIQTIVIVAPHAVKVFNYLTGKSDNKPIVLLAVPKELRSKVENIRKKNGKE